MRYVGMNGFIRPTSAGGAARPAAARGLGRGIDRRNRLVDVRGEDAGGLGRLDRLVRRHVDDEVAEAIALVGDRPAEAGELARNGGGIARLRRDEERNVDLPSAFAAATRAVALPEALALAVARLRERSRDEGVRPTASASATHAKRRPVGPDLNPQNVSSPLLRTGPEPPARHDNHPGSLAAHSPRQGVERTSSYPCGFAIAR